MKRAVSVSVLAAAALAGCSTGFDPADPCWQRTVSAYRASEDGAPAYAAAEAHLAQETEQAICLIEEALALRAETIAAASRLEQRIAAAAPLSGADLDQITRGTLSHADLREKLLEVAYAHEPWVVAPEVEMQHLGLAPVSRFKGVTLSLAAALTLYDNYLLAVSLFEDHPKLRMLVNSGDAGYEKARHALSEITLAYNSARNRRRVRAAMAYYEQAKAAQSEAIAADSQMGYLNELIQSSPSYQRVRDIAPWQVLKQKLKFAGAVSKDGLKRAGAEGINLFSMFFGNTVGLVEARKGKLFRRPAITEAVCRELRAGDILLEKTPFRLTDKLIPGHWGHVAIWLGNESELTALGLWEHPMVAKHWDAIRAGRLVIEALRSGVELNPLEKFLNVDDLCVLRDDSLQDVPAHCCEHLVRALRQVGKAYDFNFDVETTDRIVCSELCYVVYTEIDWPTENMLGRATISPDNIAQEALGGCLSLVTLYHDGFAVTDEPLVRFKELLVAPPGAATSSGETAAGGGESKSLSQ